MIRAIRFAAEEWVRKSRPTLKDIAAELNLTHPTVSRALSDHGSISAETKAKVREAANRLGYVPNSSARVLRKGHSNVVGLLLPDITNEFYAAVAQRLADDCSARSQQLLLSISADDPDRELAMVRALLEARPFGVVVALSTSPHPETLAYLRSTYCVQFMQVHQGLKGPSVTVEDSGGAKLAMQHLLELGHRRIGFVGPYPSSSLGNARLRGINKALAAAGHRLDKELVRLGQSTPRFGQQAVADLLDLAEPPTALYLSTAPISLGGMRSLSGRVSTPSDISVIVAGSAAWYDVWPGGLTSITLPMTKLADAASKLIAAPADKAVAAPRIKLAFQLIERGSTAACSR